MERHKEKQALFLRSLSMRAAILVVQDQNLILCCKNSAPDPPGVGCKWGRFKSEKRCR